MDLQKLIQDAEVQEAIKADPHVDPNEKESIFSFIEGPDPVGHLVSGVIGAQLVSTINIFQNLNPTTRALLTVAGFGLGNLLANQLVRSTNKQVSTTPDGKTQIHT